MKEHHTVLLRQFFVGDETDLTAFKEAGDELVDFIARGEKYRWYEDFLRPIGFLYRHYFELELKNWIKELNQESSDEVANLLKQHNLKVLWLTLKPLIQPFCGSKENQDFLRDVEEVILTFDKYDPTGQEFRYIRTTKGMKTLMNLPSKFDIKEVQRLIGRVSSFFDGLGGVISV